MSGVQITFAVYALLMFGGGFMGYKKVGSKASLIMGTVSALIVAFGVFMVEQNVKTGYSIIALMSTLLTLTFLIRLFKTKKFMPAGMLFLLSTAASGLSIAQLLK